MASNETTDHVRACRRSLPPSLDREKVVFGFDGVVDRVRRVVATRRGPDEYETMETMDELHSRIADAAALDTSCSIEWQHLGERAGGHTSHLGRAMERLGCKPTLIGTYGDPPRATFTEEFERADLISLGEASTTDAIEFTDGKVLLSTTGRLATLDWPEIRDTVGLNVLASRLDRTRVLGIGYWATILQLPSIIDGLVEEVWPRLRDPPERVLFDPADVRRLSDETLVAGIDAIDRLDDTVPVVVSSNRRETLRIATLFEDVPEDSLADAARVAREGLNVSTFVAHAVDEAVSVSPGGVDRVAIPTVDEPVLTTSAGDHFNAGLVLGHVVGLDPGPRLIAGSSVAGHFVRTGEPPTYDDVLAHVDRYDDLLADSSPAN